MYMVTHNHMQKYLFIWFFYSMLLGSSNIQWTNERFQNVAECHQLMIFFLIHIWKINNIYWSKFVSNCVQHLLD